MNRMFLTAVTGIAMATLLLTAGIAGAQGLTAQLDPSGMITVARGTTPLAMIELNAHGPGWAHAAQETATAEVSPLPDGGRQFVGTLPIPGTEGAIAYTQTVTPLPQGMHIAYDLTMNGALKLNGLQFSVNLPVATHAGKEILISQPGGDPQISALPQERKETSAQVWSGQGAKIEVASGTPDAVTIEVRAATDVMIQDLRQWQNEVYEVRLPAIMQAPGREMTADDRFHLDVTITFAAPVSLQGP